MTPQYTRSVSWTGQAKRRMVRSLYETGISRYTCICVAMAKRNERVVGEESEE